jgi:hypothetical protein
MPLATFLLVRVASLAFHESSHALVALALGFQGIAVRIQWMHTAVSVPGIDERSARLVRHAGWISSVVLAMLISCCMLLSWPATAASWYGPAVAASWYTALEAVASDLLCLMSAEETFFCGNFGLIMLRSLNRHHVLPILRTMTRTTMVRGAQSAGIVTYRQQRRHSGVRKAQRIRVSNGKRTDLCDMLLGHGKTEKIRVNQSGSQLFSGHTRFATSSQATLDGCHPHRWSPPSWVTEWTFNPAIATFVEQHACCEAYVTHNGDLDFFAINGHEYTLAEIQALLPQILHRPMPSPTDSCCLAGLFELLRTKGIWLHSVRYAALYGLLGSSRASAVKLKTPSALWSERVLHLVAKAFEDVYAATSIKALLLSALACVYRARRHGPPERLFYP